MSKQIFGRVICLGGFVLAFTGEVANLSLARQGYSVEPNRIQDLNENDQPDHRSLKETVGDRFQMGVGVGHLVLRNEADADLVRQHFQIITPENCMKPQGIHPGEEEWDFAAADRFVDFARENQLDVVGHCLVWAKDDRTDEWMMLEDGRPVSRETLLNRIETHIGTVVGRYADAATMWDVVNEAIGDSGEGLLRDSIYSRTTGIDFIVTAFKAARKHDPDALLIYNDYNCHKPGKREKLIELLDQLKKAGAPVDAYGMQGHFELGDDSLSQLRETFEMLRELEIKVVVSELDIDVVKRGRWWADGGKHRDELSKYDPYREGLPVEIEQQQIEQYVALFKLFDEFSDIIERVSFWNLHDGESWLNYFPWRRVNHPLLFDRNRQPKPAFDAVCAFLEAQNNAREASSPGRDVPLVYDAEHTGESFPRPILPAIEDLPNVRPLTDPFAWSDGRGRSTAFSDWSRRRAEIKAEIEHYGIGVKPPRPDDIAARYDDGILTVDITENGETLTLTARIGLPEGDGPFPAVIGIGRGSGSLPTDIFESRNIATIAFNFGQVMAHTQSRGREPINRLYPELTYIGAYSAWSWGVSRLIDGLELVQDDLPIDLQRIAITGCSFAGKMALFAGALDERIALTIAQESGGGGAAAWRVSETLGNVETLGKTSSAWFIEDMFRFSNNVSKLPYDHHELMAMVAPRALLVLGNPDYEWLADESGYVSCRAAHEVWKGFGVPDRFGFSIVGGHPHCRLPDSQRPEVEAFVDKFLLGDQTANTDITKHPFENVEYAFWYDGWLTGESTFPQPDTSNVESIYFEVEQATVGAAWKVGADDDASAGKYLAIESGMNSTDAAPSGTDGLIRIPFEVGREAKFFIFARVNCPSADDDSFWVKVDDGDYVMANGLRTFGWDWVKLTTLPLRQGEHTLTIAYREDGALIDKIGITTYVFGPTGMGAEAIKVGGD